MTKDNQTIQQKIDQLDQAVAWFESDDFELEQASVKLKEAAKLAADIEHDLDNVANDIQIVKKSFASDSE
ncbi:MAG: exodeoxyribonuclease small subunit [Patescibacteria group bacterium]|jgi:exonuclease VII small subunit|nr:exodeoxyribonuclease small subunit [Patescibacteria group bacterium]